MDRLDLLKPLIETNKNIFISGIGGTGKSYLISLIYEYLKSFLPINTIALTSTTGISAYNIKGRTIHSFTGIILPNSFLNPEFIIDKIYRKILSKPKLFKTWSEVKVIIIDEVSMLGANYIDVMNIIAQKIRKNNLPMGGIQLILGGDLLQLPPVNDDFCFNSGTWNYLNLTYVFLQKAFRFTDQKWIETLSRIRVGCVTKDDLSLLKSCLTSVKKFDSNNEEPGETKLIIKPTYICPLKKEVETINMFELKNIEEKEYNFESFDYCDTFERECYVNEKEIIDNYLNTPQQITLKIGCQVMLLVNLDVELGLVNGSRGVITNINYLDRVATVKFKNCIHPIGYYKFHSVESDNVYYTRTMIPLTVAYGISIHKSQSCTIDMALVNCGKGIFESGQAYVALSRVKNPEGLYLTEFNVNKIKCNQKALDFENKIKENAIIID